MTSQHNYIKLTGVEIGKSETHVEIWLLVAHMQLSQFLLYPVHIPFSNSTGLHAWKSVVPPFTAHYKYLILSSKVDHLQGIKLGCHSFLNR